MLLCLETNSKVRVASANMNLQIPYVPIGGFVFSYSFSDSDVKVWNIYQSLE